MRTNKCIATDGSKMENVHIDRLSDNISWELRIVKVMSIFTVLALATGETQEIIEKNILRAKFSDFLGLGKRPKKN
jgi:hypothetical protein